MLFTATLHACLYKSPNSQENLGNKELQDNEISSQKLFLKC
jgi:hypothetical protein